LIFALVGVIRLADTREGVIGLLIGTLVSIVAVPIARRIFPARRKKQVVPWVAFVAVLLGILGGGTIGNSIGQRILAPFRDLKDRYALRDWKSFSVASAAEPSIRAKILIIYDRHVALVYPPETMRPRTPQEVGTIVYIFPARGW
jgi:hypothetical protein